MNDDLTPVEAQAIDALLGETLGKTRPPDLTAEIMARLHQADADIAPLVRAPLVQAEDRLASRTGETRLSMSTKNFTALITAIAAVAAMFLLAIWLRSDGPSPNSYSTLAGNDPALTNQPVTEPDSPSPQIDIPVRESPEAARLSKPRRGIPMDLAIGGDDPTDMTHGDQGNPSPPSLESLDALVLVSQQVDSELRGYWDAIGIEPSSDAAGEEIAARLSARLDADLAVDSIDDPDQLRAVFAVPSVSLAIAARWLEQITERGVFRVDQETRNGLIEDLAACFRSGRSFDEMLAGWIAGESPSSAAFYAAVSFGPKHAGDNIAMARRLAALTMNVDLRCTRCHDSYIEGNGRQEDYWAFDAFLSRGVTRGRDGQVTIDAAPRSGKHFFYALPDGRQRFVEPSVATTWMHSRSDQPIASVRDWSQQLVGSSELARGVVNSLWQLVHGQPLHGRVVDLISAPRHDSLDRLEEDLVQDLIRSKFDVARMLALIIASPATRRSVPASLLPENALVASESEISAAKNAVDAFAAAQPPRNALAMNDRLDQVMRVAGVRLSTDGSPIVAQIGSAADNSPNRKSDSTALAADFPGPAKSHPVQWLSLIEDENSQVEHLGYLAGMSQVPDNVLQVAEKMRDAGDASTSLHRVWWMVRP